MLNEEVQKYRDLSGDDNPNTPISRIGGYLDGYERALEQCQRTGRWIFKYFDSDTGIRNTGWCSECDKPFVGIYKNYCPNCGSFNGGEQDGSTSGTPNP